LISIHGSQKKGKIKKIQSITLIELKECMMPDFADDNAIYDGSDYTN